VGWIYAFKDRGFEKGVKVGRDEKHPSRYKHAQCYTPRGIDLVAVWNVTDRFSNLAEAETVARRNLPGISNSNGGVEWLNLTTDEAKAKVSANLGLNPEPHHGNPRITTTYDDFRDPKHLRGKERYRQLLWVYRENKTGIIKVQRTESSKVPQEPVKTYSILGFKPMACFAPIPTGNIHKDNLGVHSIWVNIVDKFGYGTEHIQVGWLKPEIKIELILKEIKRCQMEEITDWSKCAQFTKTNR